MDEARDMDVSRLFAGQHGVAGRRQLADSEVSRGVVRRALTAGRWVELQPRAYVVAGAPETYEQRLLAAVLASTDAAATHRAAARLHQMPGFDTAPVEITAHYRDRRRQPLTGVIRHYSTLLPPRHRKTLHAIPTTTVARTLFDLCAVVHPGRAARAVDNCLARKWVTLPALWRVLDELAVQGRNGTCALREILTELGDGYVAPASELERLFMDLLRRSGLPAPAREVDLRDADKWNGRVEFVYREQRLLIEIDSRLHHTALLDVEHDDERDNAFVSQGFRVLRFKYKKLKHKPPGVERIIRRALRASPAGPGGRRAR
jgi:hypothetical protein